MGVHTVHKNNGVSNNFDLLLAGRYERVVQANTRAGKPQKAGCLPGLRTNACLSGLESVCEAMCRPNSF